MCRLCGKAATETSQRPGRDPNLQREPLAIVCKPAPNIFQPVTDRDLRIISNGRARMVENFEVFDFALTDAEQAAITALEREGRVGSHPDEVN